MLKCVQLLILHFTKQWSSYLYLRQASISKIEYLKSSKKVINVWAADRRVNPNNSIPAQP